MLKFILPSGSLANAVRYLLKQAGYDVSDPDRRGFCGIANGIEFWQLDRRTIPRFLKTGKYHAGLTGRDLLIASGVEGLHELRALNFSRSSDQPTRWVLAQRKDWEPVQGCNIRIGCELPGFARKVLTQIGLSFSYTVEEIFGSEEQCVRDELIDMVLVVTETGSSIKANGLEIVPGYGNVFESTPVLIAVPELDGDKKERLEWLSAALRLSLGAKQKVVVLCDVPTAVDLPSLNLPSIVAPTVAPLTEGGWCACTICIPFSEQGRVASILEENGARGILVIPVQGYLA